MMMAVAHFAGSSFLLRRSCGSAALSTPGFMLSPRCAGSMQTFHQLVGSFLQSGPQDEQQTKKFGAHHKLRLQSRPMCKDRRDFLRLSAGIDGATLLGSKVYIA